MSIRSEEYAEKLRENHLRKTLGRMGYTLQKAALAIRRT